MILLIHFLPVENYPPAMNIINDLVSSSLQVEVYTNRGDRQQDDFRTNEQNVRINRVGRVEKNFWSNIICYLRFASTIISECRRRKYDKIIMFEVFSIWPLLYKQDNVRYHVHYHEYTEKSNVKFLGLYERLMWFIWRFVKHKATYSHTNIDRLSLFLKDWSLTLEDGYIFPNLPPISWRSRAPIEMHEINTIRLVYVGALSVKTMYLKEIVNFVKNNPCYTLDIYSQRIDEEANNIVNNLPTKRIRFHGSVGYSMLNNTLKNYHIGLILYKGHNSNYRLNIPNKNYEYLSSGLGVWYSENLTTLKTANLYNTIPLKFEELEIDLKGQKKFLTSLKPVSLESSSWYNFIVDR